MHATTLPCFSRPANRPAHVRLQAAAIALLLSLSAGVNGMAAPPDASPEYNRDVRPILSEKCFRCHGFDAATREGELRLDRREDATRDRDGYRVVDPGNPQSSELLNRVRAKDADQRMPPHDSGLTLSPREIATLQRWIADGAVYQPHWSFVPPRRPALPTGTRSRRREANPIDSFVLDRLDQLGLGPAPRAAAATLIRRVTLDLTGLPPTLAEVDAFEQACRVDSEAAYTRLVDRLLASPRFGEHLAVGWLDAARYADTNGYFTDNDRTMWRWRDGVIDAFNRNVPFDQFTIEQLAGDLLPQATVEQKVATGFNRNHMVNNETGIVEEEFRTEYVVDRVDTTATVWLGLTLGCARCHDHKYDPISQEDFYRFFAFFNNVPERGLSGSSGNAEPLIRVPSLVQQAELDALQRQVQQAEQSFQSIDKELAAAQTAWESTALQKLPPGTQQGVIAQWSLDDLPAGDSTVGTVTPVPGVLGQAVKFAGDGAVQVGEAWAVDRDQPFSFGAWIRPESAGCVISKIDDGNQMRGFDVSVRKGKVMVNLVHQWNRNAIQVSSAASLAMHQWQHLLVAYDGSGRAAGVQVYFNGELQPTLVAHDTLTGSLANSQPWRLGRRAASASYKGSIDEVRLYDRCIGREEAVEVANGQLLRGVLSRPVDQRDGGLSKLVRDYFLEHHAEQDRRSAAEQLGRLKARFARLSKQVPTAMVMGQRSEPRQTFVLLRGQYDQAGKPVSAGLLNFGSPPSAGPQSPEAGARLNRLDLAKWLVDPANPLTARVTVNRLWLRLFGVGIVQTADDFGTQGEWPSHPRLLDWLATEFIRSEWDIKHVVRLMVTSSTYRQSAHGTPQLLARDPDNRWLARGPRYRMGAEMIRDNALALSGLLVERMGGPSVKPYQPAGLWRDVTYDSDEGYEADRGASLYRRSLYTFWKRQAPPPTMLVFDAPTRETCTVQRTRTNSPLQALALMNDPTFVEAARKLAEHVMNTNAATPEARASLAFRTATARRADSAELAIVLDIYRAQQAVYQRDRKAAEQLVQVGESSWDRTLPVAELAAWTTVASMILSLDETITKP